MCGLIATTDINLFGAGGWRNAMQSLDSRGPDASGEWTSGRLGFGHRRLAIIGLGSAGAQPATGHPDHVLVFNGEIYNYRQLGREIGLDAESDTQVLYAIARQGWGGWIHRLRGMYAFVHLNRRTGVLTAARDPFGIKPLYVRRHTNGEISFASTVAALLATTEAPGPDHAALAGFLAGGLFPAGTSAFANIEKVEPGRLHTWTPLTRGYEHASSAVPLSDWPQMSVPRAVHDSVSAHLVSDVELGILLSGGVDSTLLAAAAARKAPGIRTFSLTNPDDPDIDEAAFARHNSELLGTEHVEVPVSPATLAERASGLLRATGEPFGDAAYLPLSALAEVVSKYVKVALAGEGADELFAGYRRYDIEKYIESPFSGPAVRAGARVLRADRRFPHPRSQRDRSAHAAALRTPAARHAALMGAEWDMVRRFLGVTAAEAIDTRDRRWQECSRDPWALGQPPNRAHDTREWLPNVFLEKSDRASMLHSLELRTPFLDPAVATAVLGWQPHDTRKKPLRDELQRLLPGVSLPRRKKGLSVNTEALVGTHYRGLVERTVLDPDSVLSAMGLVDRVGFLAEVDRSSALPFRIAMLGMWQEMWL